MTICSFEKLPIAREILENLESSCRWHVQYFARIQHVERIRMQ